MYKNIGGKIKGLTKWVSLISIILIWVFAVLGALVSSMPGLRLTLLICAAIASVLVWIGSWALYAFGEIAEDIHAIREYEDAKIQAAKKSEREAWLNTEIFYCPNCNNIVKNGENTCKKCGQEFEWSDISENLAE